MYGSCMFLIFFFVKQMTADDVRISDLSSDVCSADLSSPAVVIGAMLLSPLMGPIIGLGFALAIGDYRWLKDSVRSLAWGTLMAVVLCALIVYFSPIQTRSAEPSVGNECVSMCRYRWATDN